MPVLQLGEQLFIYYLDNNPIGKPAVLLIHGLGVTGESWGFQLPELIGAGYRAIVPDLRGFGKSSYPGGDNRIEDITEDMACLLSHLSAAQAHVVGISLGGAIALQLALGRASPDGAQRHVRPIAWRSFSAYTSGHCASG